MAKTRKLKNYLRANRRRACLTQDEVAFILGSDCGSKVSRYERLIRKPDWEAMWGYEVLFGQPSKALFAGEYLPVRIGCLGRVLILLHKLAAQKQTRRAILKQKSLRACLEREGVDFMLDKKHGSL